MSNMKSRIPGIAEGLRTQLRNWLCNALGVVLALPPLSVIQTDDRAAASPALARKRFTIDEVLFATGHDEVCPTLSLLLSDRGFAALAVQMCRLFEEEVVALENTLLTGAR